MHSGDSAQVSTQSPASKATLILKRLWPKVRPYLKDKSISLAHIRLQMRLSCLLKGPVRLALVDSLRNIRPLALRHFLQQTFRWLRRAHLPHRSSVPSHVDGIHYRERAPHTKGESQKEPDHRTGRKVHGCKCTRLTSSLGSPPGRRRPLEQRSSPRSAL